LANWQIEPLDFCQFGCQIQEPNMRTRMRTPKPPALSAKEQAQRYEERLATEAEASARLGALAREPVDAEVQRIRALQRSLNIVRFEDLPAAKPLLAIERTLTTSLQRIKDERDLIHVERYLSGAMQGLAAPTGEKAKEFRERRDKLKAKLKVGTAEPPAPKADALPETIVRALEVFSDKPVKDRPAPGARLAELDEMEIVVSAGIYDISALIAALRGDAGYDQAAALQKHHGALSLQLFRAAQKFAEAAEAERSLRTAFTSAGYSPRYDVLPGMQLSAVLVLGSESDYASQLSQYRRFLQDKGLLR
jgi:hypothetical protein